jgi:hypothetical protein
MKKVGFTIISFLMLLSLSYNTSLYGDDRLEPVDLVIAVDKSLSMDDKIEAVKQYVNNYLIKNILIVNDYLLVVEFYEKADVAAAGYIYTEADKQALMQKVSEIKADGKWTDIGNALDRLRDEFTERYNNGRKKVFLFISDGINEVPRTSKYYNAKGSLNHEYLAKLKDYLDQQNWKVKILKIGDDQELKELESQFEGDVRKFNTTGKDNDFEVLGTMDVLKDSVQVLQVGGDGKGTLVFTIQSQRFQQPQSLVINSIKLVKGAENFENILITPLEVTIPENGSTEVKIPVSLRPGLEPGTSSGELTFAFKNEEHFADLLNIQIQVRTLIEDLPWLIPVIILAAILFIILVVFIIRKIIQSNALRFRLIVEEMPLPKGRDIFKIAGKPLFLMESMDLVRIAERLTPRCIAKLYARGADLKIAILKEKGFPEVKKVPDNLLGHTLIVNTESGRKYHCKFEEV